MGKIVHGKTHTRTYHTWSMMKQRCYNPKHFRYMFYGGRGITVCERWRNSFIAFYEDMGERPSKCTLDRIDNDGNYTPENCRWATAVQQGNNRITNRGITCKGETKNLKQWAAITGIDRSLISRRLHKGWPIEKALFQPVIVMPHIPHAPNIITFNGETKLLSEWSRITGIARQIIRKRIARGFPLEQVLDKQFRLPMPSRRRL